MKQIRNIPTKDYIVEAIRNEILAGHMEAGEELTQETLAEMLGVSRMPVREALQTLVQEGFVERLPNRHMKVVALNQEQIIESFRVIAALEGEIAVMMIEKSASMEMLAKLTTALDLADETIQIAELEQEFHKQLVNQLGNQYLTQTFDRLMRGYVSYAIHHFSGEVSGKVMIREIYSLMEAMNRDGVKSKLQQYYAEYAAQF